MHVHAFSRVDKVVQEAWLNGPHWIKIAEASGTKNQGKRVLSEGWLELTSLRSIAEFDRRLESRLVWL